MSKSLAAREREILQLTGRAGEEADDDTPAAEVERQERTPSEAGAGGGDIPEPGLFRLLQIDFEKRMIVTSIGYFPLGEDLSGEAAAVALAGVARVLDSSMREAVAHYSVRLPSTDTPPPPAPPPPPATTTRKGGKKGKKASAKASAKGVASPPARTSQDLDAPPTPEELEDLRNDPQNKLPGGSGLQTTRGATPRPVDEKQPPEASQRPPRSGQSLPRSVGR